MDKELTSPMNAASANDRGAADLTVLHEAAKLIGHSGTPEIAITGTLRLMSQMLGLNRGRVLLPSTADGLLRIRYSYGLTEAERKRGLYSFEEGITGKVMQSGQQVVVQDVDQEPGFLFRAVDRATLPEGVVSYLAVPIMDGNLTVGVLAAHRLRMRPRAINADLVILRILATFIAQIIKINGLIDERTSHLREENQELKEALEQQQNNYGILGESAAVRDALLQITRVADTPVTVLLTGESGTGKERFSQILHLNSKRRDLPFLAINCAAIPEQLLESELFGHEKGAFTGATSSKQGKIELANGGTLFLDEIGDLNMELQSKLLRVLESQLIQRVGGIRDIPVDVRIVTATHKNLQEAVNRGTFRLDLFYRLNVFPIHLPPLRERTGDVRILARHFLLNANREYGRYTLFGKGVMERLESYNWPGNIRQLENVIKRAVLIALDGNITIGDIESILRQESVINSHLEAGQSALAQPSPLPPPESAATIVPVSSAGSIQSSARPYSWVREDEEQTLLEALQQTGGNKTRAAALLGMTARQFRYRLEKLSLTDSL
ncbi:sigma-54-dependent Fis family transcriptional regulator [Marinobacterium iners]|uniref:Transcriptional regulator, NifA subfamily, Fis family n=1 Tax=Marinobacterium iners DSM 11526 TaxID=1122198 RepID=A0A1H4H2E2_9GAMM|nr:sigma 54-interacting transcriptional regulator [Marinobacterium iners]SEB15791.1 transcriptional regulator, NifA subfamily, Fis family [Marinobacterium iners DSM 11526]